MAASDNVVSVKFGGSTDELNAAVDETKAKIAEVHEPVDELSAKLSSLGETFLAAFTLDKIAEFTEGIAEAAVQVQRLSDISGLSAETVQTLQFAMEATGGNAESAGMMMTRFGRSVAEAASGTGPAFDAFQKLGIGLNALRHDSEANIFDRAIAGFKNVSDTAQQSQIGIQIFSRGYLNLAAALRQGPEGLQKFRDELRATGAEMNEERTGAFAGLFQDIHLMKDSWQGLGEQILDAFLPAIKLLAQALTGIAMFLREIVKETQLAAEGFKYLFGLQDKATTQKNAREILDTPDSTSPSGGAANRGQLTADQMKAAKQQYIEDSIRMDEEEYESSVALEAQKVAKHEDTKQQELSADIRYLTAERDLVLTSLSQELALQEKGTAEYQKIADEKELIATKFNTDIIRLNTEYIEQQEVDAEKQARVWKQAFDEIGQDYDKLVEGFFKQTQTMGQVFQQFAQQIVIQFTEAVTKMVARYAGSQLLNLFGEGGSAASRALSGGPAGSKDEDTGLMTQFVTYLGSLIGITGAQVGADTAQTTALAANTAALAANTAAVSAGSIAGAAGGGGGAAEDLLGALPLLGFATGTPYVPNNMVAKIHKGEMIIPAGPAEAIRQGSISTLSGGDAAHVHFHINAMDSDGVKKTLMRNHAAIAAAVVASARGGNSTLRTAFAKM